MMSGEGALRIISSVKFSGSFLTLESSSLNSLSSMSVNRPPVMKKRDFLETETLLREKSLYEICYLISLIKELFPSTGILSTSSTI